MGFNCGIVGLPNVGKSTLFNAIIGTAAAAAENYPFCTIEPNVGRVPVPDPRLERVAEVAGSARVVPTQLEVVDIAGLVRGASRGEGLGNRFLAAIREVDAILHVLRCFEDGEIAHVEGSIDPVRDLELVETELLLADIASLERRIEGLTKRARGGDSDARAQLALVERILPEIQAGRPARSLELAPEERARLDALQLLSAKPILYVCNVDEASAAHGNAFSAAVAARAAANGAETVVVSAAIEAEIAALAPAERLEYLRAIGLEQPGLHRVIVAGYRLLDLITFFTAGPKEARAWTIRRGTRAQDAAGVIHSDFKRGFICAEVAAWDEFVRYGGEAGVREAGRLRQEGRDYIIQDGEVVRFRFNV
ncbi:MAG TPA: redox-regulated ATPase YchF [Geminicoccaceae bacterium]|nr:redox-regulated ATPase YchF [Geminicoccaceae bacterium]